MRRPSQVRIVMLLEVHSERVDAIFVVCMCFVRVLNVVWDFIGYYLF